MGGLSSIGIGSGLDGNALVERLVSAERAAPERRLNRKEATLQAELSAFGVLKSKASELGDALGALAGLSEARKSSLSNRDLFSATVSDGASLGRYGIVVNDVARAQSLATQATFAGEDAVVGTGTLSLSVGGGAAVDVAIDAENQSLGGIRDAINAAEAGVTAVVLNDGTGERLILTANDSGLANTIDVAVTEDGGTPGLSALRYTAGDRRFDELVAPTDASLTVNGLPVTRTSNEIDDLLPGVALTLQGADSGTEVRLDVASDPGATRKAVEAFVEQYNEVLKTVKSATNFDPESGRGGPLVGDSTVRGFVGELRSALVSSLETDAETFSTLVEIGVTTGPGGTLEIDSARLDDALASDFGGVNALLASAGERFGGIVDRFADDDGRIDARTDGLRARIDDVADSRERLEQRIADVEARYRREFGALDTLVAQLNQTSSFLGQQLANLPTPSLPGL
jgi:flagellar hook-associated protein 2